MRKKTYFSRHSRHEAPAECVCHFGTNLVSSDRISERTLCWGYIGRVCAVVEVVGEVVEVTAGPMSQFFWKVNEIKALPTFCKLARVFCTRSLVPKVVDSNCGAENLSVVKI